MSDADVELGPVNYVAVAFPAGQANSSGETASELTGLMKSITERVLDLLLTQDIDGSMDAAELRNATQLGRDQVRTAEGARRGVGTWSFINEG